MKIFIKANLLQTKISLIVLISTLLISCSTTTQNISYQSEADSLIFVKQLRKLSSSQNQVILRADKLLNKNFRTIIDKKILPPSGDKHDYLSRAIYYWPDLKLNNKKWKYIDGEINKESLTKTDHNTYYKMLRGLQDLSLAYKISGDDKFAKKSVELIKEWFLNEETKMNPHFNYAQAIPGRNSGSPSGIIDARGILWVIDAIKLIRNSKHWDYEFEANFKEWCSELLDWLKTSAFGKREAAANNNHGSYYDLQIIKLATFLGKYEIAKNQINTVTKKRLEKQIDNDGSQIEELKRANPFLYSIFNLSALIEIAEIAENYDIDLWNYKKKNSGTIKKAIDFVVRNTLNNSQLLGKNISKRSLLVILPRIDDKFNNEYKTIIENLLEQYNPIDLKMIYFTN